MPREKSKNKSRTLLQKKKQFKVKYSE